MPRVPKVSPWRRFVSQWGECQACSLASCRRNVVLARGSIPADVLFIGEAPGLSEDLLGRPFVGPAGKLLDKMISEATGLYHDVKIAFTNVVCCIPLEEGAKVSEPPKEAVLECLPRLEQFLQIVQPRLVVAVGGVSAKNLGKHTDYEFVDIVHPAAILRAPVDRQGLAYQRAVVTLREAFRELETSDA